MQKENLAIPTEEEEQAILFRWAELSRATMPELEMLYHIPNGGLRSKTEAARFKAAGVKAGVPDICLPVARGEYHGLYIELKDSRAARYQVSKRSGYAVWMSKATLLLSATAGWQRQS